MTESNPAHNAGDGMSDDPVLSPEELERYARHIVLPEVGGPGQQRLKAARVLIIGAGGLGQPIVEGLYLNDSALILSGALPAAALALAVDGALGLLARVLTPRGLREG